MRAIAQGVHVTEAPLRFFGIEVGARMTVLETDAGLLVHSPLAVELETLEAVGEPAHVVAPNKLHHLYAGPWIERGLPVWAAPGLPEKRKDLAFAGVLEHERHPFGDDIGVYPLTCFPFSSEVVLHHRPSGTLVVTDLVFNFGPDAPLLTRAAMTLALGYPGCCTTLLERVGFHRSVARTEIRALLELDFDRLVMSHGNVIDTGGKNALRNAFGWLGL